MRDMTRNSARCRAIGYKYIQRLLDAREIKGPILNLPIEK
jgi:hypothetical protein